MQTTVWYTPGFHKVRPGEATGAQTSCALYAPKNGGDACQLVFVADHDTVVTVTAAPLVHDGGATLPIQPYAVGTIAAGRHGVWPDPLTPLTGDLALRAGEPRAVFLRVRAPAGAPAGLYTGAVEATIDGERRSFPLTMRVWDVTLPATPACQTLFGLHRYCIEDLHGVPRGSEEGAALYRAYYDYLLDHGISSYDLPVDLLSPEADRYLDDERMTAFVIPYVESDETQNRYFAKLRQKRSWFAKGVFYPLDEPASRESYDRLRTITDRLARLEPNFRQVVPFYANPQYDYRLSAFEEMVGRIRVWCPESCLLDNVNMWDKIGRGPDNSLPAKLEARRNAGETVWWYVCCGPDVPYCNLFIPMAGLCHRTLFWQQFQHHVDGLLYWGADFWHKNQGPDDPLNGTADPWTDMATVKHINADLYGDGSLLYNGNRVGIDGPVGSLRLEAVTDGLYDFGLLTIARQVLGDARTAALLQPVCTSLTSYTADEAAFLAARAALGDAVEAALK